MTRHLRFIGRTVLTDLKNTSIGQEPWEKAYLKLNYQLNSEGILQSTKRNRYYEKPWMKRRRLAYEECKYIYTQEMTRKIDFISIKNRRDPWRVEVD